MDKHGAAAAPAQAVDGDQAGLVLAPGYGPRLLEASRMQKLVDPYDQFGRGEGSGKIIIRATFENTDFFFQTGLVCEDENRDQGAGRLVAQTAGEIIPAAIGQLDITDNQLGRGSRCDLKRPGRIDCRGDIAIKWLQRMRDHLMIDGFFADQQNACHNPFPGSSMIGIYILKEFAQARYLGLDPVDQAFTIFE